MTPAKLPLTGDPDADRLLEDDPLALLIGMLLDQQVTMEKAFHSPYELKERLGGRLDAAEIGAMDPDELKGVFAELFANLKALPGFGDQKAKIFIALLGKRLGVHPPGWEEAAGFYAEHGCYSVADVDGPESLTKVREYKRAA